LLAREAFLHAAWVEVMKVRLISRNLELRRLCRRVLLEFRGRDWDFGLVATAEQARDAGLTIWDVVPASTLPERLDFDQERTNIFLVDRQQAVTLLEMLPFAEMSILLKPVNERLLHDFLAHVLARHEARHDRSDLARLGQLRLERDEILQGLLISNLRLQEFDQDRTCFLGRCVHELRAPLTAVYGYCGMLLDKQIGPLNSEQVRILERMQRSAGRLTRLIAAMFEISVGRQARGTLSPKAGDIRACIDQAVYEITPVADSKSVAVRVNTVPPTEQILFEPSHIEQVLINLLDNACRFTPNHGRIDIESGPAFWDRRSKSMREDTQHEDRRAACSKRPNAFRIEVRDSGPGIQSGDSERIFEEFTSESAKTDRSRGGLGLSICRQIIQSYQGHIFAESGGEGAKFVVILPYAPRELLPQPAARQSEAVAMRIDA
jgi:signal transduction histidine kinase